MGRNIFLLIAGYLLFTAPAFAAGSATGAVSFQDIGGWSSAAPSSPPTPSGTLVFFTVAGYSGGPGCATQSRFVLDLAMPPAKTQYATLLAAKLLAKPVYVLGTGTCGQWADSESIATINIP
jgi:hypothetical protein